MSAALTVARKELRAAFQSPIALIFLGVFLLVTLYTFFSYSLFFSRNLADVRPLFEWLPLLLIFLVSAITMRQWAEEQKAGTLEILLTLPLRTRDLVLGKFLAALALVGLGLLLTLPLPLTVSTLGNLDWGPVIGGYLGALLLGSVYLAIGLCVSARTDNQVVALMMTLVIGGLLYLIGSEPLTALLSTETAELLRGLGTGSRFSSIERGVIDLRDIVYYGTLTAFFLTLNVAFLEVRRLDRGAEAGRSRYGQQLALVGLVGANAVALNLWLAPVNMARADLTADGDYSISPVTTEVLASLDEPLTIRGYFSERTHRLLAPLVPQIRDVLEEYEIRGDGRVRVEIVDPNTSEKIQQEIGERYGIRSMPFRDVDRHSQSIVNSYFHLLVTYGDEYEVLTFDELVDVMADEDGVDVRLRNLEYDLTRTIKRVSQDFQSIEAVMAKLPDGATLTAYITADASPEVAEAAELARKVGMDLAERSQGQLSFTEVDPTSDPALRDRLLEEYQIQPFVADLFGSETFYLHLVLTAGETVERLVPQPGATEADVRTAVEAAIRRATPGQLKTIGIATMLPENPPPNPQMPPQMQPPPKQPDYRALTQMLADEYEVERIDLTGGAIPPTLDVLIIGKTGPMDAQTRFAVDQFLMRGGSVIALVSSFQAEATRTGLGGAPVDPSLAELVEAWGVEVGDGYVMDLQNTSFPVPVQERRGMFTMERIELVPYPFLPDIRSDGFNNASPVLSGVQSATAPWSSPLSAAEVEGVETTVLMETSADSWIHEGPSIDPNFDAHPETGFAVPDERQSYVVAMSARGLFPSAFEEPPQTEQPVDHIPASLPGSRLLVLGSSDMVSDLVISLGNQPGGEVHLGNLQLVRNAIDWAVEDTELLQIRTAGAFARTLEPLDDAQRSRIELLNYAVVLVALGLVAWLPRRRNSTPLKKEDR